MELVGASIDVFRYKRTLSVQYSPYTSIGKVLYENVYEKEIQIALLESNRKDTQFAESILSEISSCISPGTLVDAVIKHTTKIFPYGMTGIALMQGSSVFSVKVSVTDIRISQGLSEFLANELNRCIDERARGETRFAVKQYPGIRDSFALPGTCNSSYFLLWIGYEGTHAITPKEKEFLRTIAECLLAACDTLKRVEMQNKAVLQAQDESNKKSSLLSQISHDVRSPLSAVQAVFDLLIRDPQQAKDNELLQSARMSVEHVKELVEDLVKFTQLKGGGVVAEKKEFELNDLIDSCVSSMKPVVEGKGLSIKHVSQVFPANILADSKQVKRIIANLLSNAYKYTHEGSITVRVQRNSHGKLCCSVIDTGIGMSEEACAMLFRPFIRFHSEIDGIGLGLSISKGLCELNQIALEVTSEVNKGSTFTLTFPNEVIAH